MATPPLPEEGWPPVACIVSRMQQCGDLTQWAALSSQCRPSRLRLCRHASPPSGAQTGQGRHHARHVEMVFGIVIGWGEAEMMMGPTVMAERMQN